MRYLRKYESIVDIHTMCRKCAISDYTINDDETIDVNENVRFNLYFKKLPLKFSNIEGYFDCSYNNLNTLQGCPVRVSDCFNCTRNRLTSLVGCPKYIGVHFFCKENKIETFEGLDFIHIIGTFNCYGNPIYDVWCLFQDHTKFEFFNDCDIIREDRVIILERLNFFLDYIGKDSVTEVSDYTCI
jgi:hypothetical protein